jgi:hypothetical protein
VLPCGLDIYGSGVEPVESVFEYGNGHSSFLKGGGFLD